MAIDFDYLTLVGAEVMGLYGPNSLSSQKVLAVLAKSRIERGLRVQIPVSKEQ